MNYGQFGRARWGVSAMALATAVGFAVPAVAQVNEILISATRRAATTVQDVPLAVTAYGGDTLQNAGTNDVRDLVALAPSFQFLSGQSSSMGTTAYLRGVGTGGDNPGFESAVGFFVDGIYRNRSGVALTDLPKVDRVEVLRGPQGTLFGKNTTAGAISVITTPPSYEGAVYGSATLGNLGIREFDAGFTAPLADNVAIRIDGNSRKRDGYINDVTGGKEINDRDRWMVRGQALLDFNDTSSMRLIFDVAQTNEHCCGAVTVARDVGGPSTATFIELFIAPFSPGLEGVLDAPLNPKDRNMSVSPLRDYGEGVDEWGVSGEYNAKLGNINFTSITSYRDWSAVHNMDVDFSDLDRAFRQGQGSGFKTFTQELRFQGNSGALDWLVGGYYARESLAYRDAIRIGTQGANYVDAIASAIGISLGGAPLAYTVYDSLVPTTGTSIFANPTVNVLIPGAAALAGLTAFDPAPNSGQSDASGHHSDTWKQTTSSWALFTHDQIALGPSWMWTFGLRYNNEHKDMKADLFADFPGCGFIQGAGLPGAGAIFAFVPATVAQGALKSGLLGLLTMACSPYVNTINNGLRADSVDESEFSGTTSLSWKWSDDLMFYGSYSRGYKAGGFNLDRSGFAVAPFSTTASPTSGLKFTPELVNAYEAGWKWQDVGGNLIINGALFLEKIKDYQLNAFSGFSFITRNVAKSISRGVEIDFYAEPHKGFTWQGGVTFLEAFFDVPVVIVGETLPKGTPFAFSPKWAATSAVTWTMPTGPHTNFVASVDARWNSSYRVQTFTRNRATDNTEYAVVNGRLGFAGTNGGWAIEAWSKNIFDEFYHLGGFAVPEQTGTFDVYPSLGRTYGGTFRIRL
jgi:outer membrane receptor protein involved in Fe transport